MSRWLSANLRDELVRLAARTTPIRPPIASRKRMVAEWLKQRAGVCREDGDLPSGQPKVPAWWEALAMCAYSRYGALALSGVRR